MAAVPTADGEDAAAKNAAAAAVARKKEPVGERLGDGEKYDQKVPPLPVAAELRKIMEELGPHPIEPVSKSMTYEFNQLKVKPLASRGYRVLPELVARIDAICPDPVGRDFKPGGLEPGGPMDYVLMAKSLLFYAADAIDESHNIAVQVSMAKRYMGSQTRQTALYTHSMIHRQEGSKTGPEGGPGVEVTGWDNAKFWFKNTEKGNPMTKEPANGPHPIHPKVLEAAKALAKGRPKFEAHVAKHGDLWSAQEFLQFCKEAQAGNDPEAVDFSGKVMSAEWRLLLEHCLEKAGMTVNA